MTYTPLPGSVAARALRYINEQLPAGGEIASSALADLIDADRSSMVPCLKAAIHHGALSHRKHDGRLLYARGSGEPVNQAPAAADEDGEAAAGSDEAGDTFTHRQVPASTAAPLAAPPGARSVFDAHGVLTAAPTKPKAKAEGKGTRVHAAKAAATPAAPSATRGHGPWAERAHAVKTPRKTGKTAAKSKPKPKPTARPPHTSEGAPTVRQRAVVAAPAPTHPDPIIAHPQPGSTHHPALACALFNTGEFVIEVPGQPPLRLARAQARELVSYLRHVEASINQEITAP